MVILVQSSDNGQDLFDIFHHCMEKYWPQHPEIIYSTESIINPHYKTICKNYPLSNWSTRIRETVLEINDDHILLLCDDAFLRSTPDIDRINYLNNLLNELDSINLERTFDSGDTPTLYDRILKRSQHGKYKTSVMMTMWNKSVLLDVLNMTGTPWEVETKNNHCNYNYYINSAEPPINIGYNYSGTLYGIRHGKWVPECIEFLKQEGIEIDTSKRGIYFND